MAASGVFYSARDGFYTTDEHSDPFSAMFFSQNLARGANMPAGDRTANLSSPKFFILALILVLSITVAELDLELTALPTWSGSVTLALVLFARMGIRESGARVASWTSQPAIHGTHHTTRPATTPLIHVCGNPQPPLAASA